MSVPASQFHANSDPVLSNAATIPPLMTTPSFQGGIASTSGGIPAMHSPALPPRPGMGLQPSYGMGYNNYGGLGMGSYGMGGYGGYGMGGMGGGYGMGGMGGYGGYNRFGGPMYGDIESRFIQMAEESSRPAFDSIQSVVSAFGSIAMMLDNTFLALTSSFRAILGVAENFGRLRSLFAQFWSTFAVIRSINWIIRKLMVLLGIRTEREFKAWADAVAATQAGTATTEQQAKGSSWPVLLFFGVIMAAPYIVFKMLRGLNNSINEKLNDPSTWQEPIRAIAQYAFEATSPQEISLSPNQVVYIAPQQVQGPLWDSGWLMGSLDKKHAGLVPVNYIKLIRPGNNSAPVVINSPEIKHEPSVQEMEEMFNAA